MIKAVDEAESVDKWGCSEHCRPKLLSLRASSGGFGGNCV